VANGHDELSRGFFNGLLLEGFRQLGASTYAGKQRLYEAGHSLEQIQEYTIFGDPALRLNTPADLRLELGVAAPSEVTPGDALTFTLAYTNAGSGLAYRPVLSHILPTLLVSPTVLYSDAQVISQHAGITFTWSLTDLLPHSGGVLRFRATVAPTATPPVAFFNRAAIASTTFDPVPWNNAASVGIGTTSIQLPLIMRGTAAP
jgi:hypothetical protein